VGHRARQPRPIRCGLSPLLVAPVAPLSGDAKPGQGDRRHGPIRLAPQLLVLEQLTNGIDPTLIVILSDINMPGMDGLQLLEAIKRRLPALPVMMVTAYEDDERRRRASDLGANEFITKPVDFHTLKAQLRPLPSAAD
jgi:CheY-like chemotaxis protein